VVVGGGLGMGAGEQILEPARGVLRSEALPPGGEIPVVPRRVRRLTLRAMAAIAGSGSAETSKLSSVRATTSPRRSQSPARTRPTPTWTPRTSRLSAAIESSVDGRPSRVAPLPSCARSTSTPSPRSSAATFVTALLLRCNSRARTPRVVGPCRRRYPNIAARFSGRTS
jgi:hypothetical protein